MNVSERAGKPLPWQDLIRVPQLIASYYTEQPEPGNRAQQVTFGTSGHRGSSLSRTFNENHIAAISQAIAEHRVSNGIKGPLFLGMDTHALSEPALRTAIEVFAAGGVEIRYQSGFGYTPTPVVSHAILCWNRTKKDRADGVLITPSHNPPSDGGFKYNPPSGGPASQEITRMIQNRANEIIAEGMSEVKRLPFRAALALESTQAYDYIPPYVDDLKNVVNLQAIRDTGINIGVDPMGGAGVAYWEPIADRYGLNLTVVNPKVDPTFSFMPADWDGKIRMDCSSPWAMANLVSLRERFDIAFGNDTDYDRHGIVTPEGLMPPNAYLSAAIRYLFTHRPNWKPSARIGKTLVSSSMIDRVGGYIGREICEVPVGFKWFVEGLLSGDMGFGGEESAGASFLRINGEAWSTDKDGFIMDLLAAEMLAVTGKNPAQQYAELTARFGTPCYARMDAPASSKQKEALKKLSPKNITIETLAGEEILDRLTCAPGNGEPIDGLKVTTANGWFAARPSGTEDVYKIYAESFLGEAHLRQIQQEAQQIVSSALDA
ncbi:MAG: phosphoglucomutase (alpha-D-glucose-1,6-bisphosphate-dependent) [Synergistaceae bacterium]|nr:phosphoglucomutase (alpha-D-glucose-1,6-bisphosphate-dependent) [Synergistaceae bacterium]MBP9957440.1 phosphoglucomutase (alpha-D-glucose-1,6-bisphosphate-dependent) [Synergistaceae bacterium]